MRFFWESSHALPHRSAFLAILKRLNMYRWLDCIHAVKVPVTPAASYRQPLTASIVPPKFSVAFNYLNDNVL